MPRRSATILVFVGMALLLSSCASVPVTDKGLLARSEGASPGALAVCAPTSGAVTKDVSSSEQARVPSGHVTDTALSRVSALSEEEVLTPVQVYDRLSRSIAFIETPTGTGSGVLTEDGYVITNAHVTWPFSSVRVVFADGSEFKEARVANSDLMVDLAVIGPIDTSLDPVPLADGEGLPVGSDVLLIGYPGEVDLFPQPAITSGLISRRREWTNAGITYYQTDAAVAGGQSGGALVSVSGEVIGISGFSYADTFGLVASMTDLAPFVESLIAGEDTSGLGDRDVGLFGGRARHATILDSLWDVQMYVINEPAGTTVDLEVSGTGDVFMVLLDPVGEVLSITDDRVFGAESTSFEIEWSAPYYVVLAQNSEDAKRYRLTCSHPLVPYYDPDDGVQVYTGETLSGSIDYPWDSDYFVIDLEEGESIRVMVDSVMIDAYLTIDYLGATEDDVLWDDDGGGGVFGLDASLEYTAPHAGTFLIVVEDSAQYEFGGYLLTVESVL